MRNGDEIRKEGDQMVQAANEALARMRGQGARWWQYMVSHHTFDLVVGDPLGKKGNVVLCLAACERIAGPVAWAEQNIEVLWRSSEDPRGESEFEVRDEAVGFTAVGALFLWGEDLNMVARGSLYLNGTEEL